MAQIYQMSLEVTRRCNMACKHCLRGGAQRVDMTKEIAYTALSNFDYISHLLFTGGEPLLNVPVISHAIETILCRGIGIGSFMVVTNGKKYSQELVDQLWRLYDVVEEPDMCSLTISRDQYHEKFSTPAVERNYWRYADAELPFFKPHDKDQFYLSKLFTRNGKKTVGFDTDALLPMGRAIDISTRDNYEICSEPITRRDDFYDGMLYVNALGDLTCDCDLSYVEQKKHKIGTYNRIDYLLRSIPDESEESDCCNSLVDDYNDLAMDVA